MSHLGFYFSLFFLVGIEFVYAKNNFPVGDGLRKDVIFWESVFIRYDSDQCVFHDSEQLQVVYGVEKIKSGTRRFEERQMNQKRSKIKLTLKRLASGHGLVSRFDRKIYKAVPRHLRNKIFYRQAFSRVRCQKGIRSNFKKSLARSEKYLPLIKGLLDNYHMPVDIAFLPHLESGFNNKAQSKVGARGLWQIMPSKAREMRLMVSRKRDERINVEMATKAALKDLKRNYKKTNSWPLALTGYNYGINGILRGMKKIDSNEFVVFRQKHQSRIFGFAAKNFYPSFLAVRNLARAYHEKKSASLKQDADSGGLLFAKN